MKLRSKGNPQVRIVLPDAHLRIPVGIHQPIASILLLTTNRKPKMCEGENDVGKEIARWMNKGTMAYAGVYNEFAQLVTDVYTTKGVFRVDLEPRKLIDKVLNYYGSNYAGAKASAKSILKTGNKIPISIGGATGFILLPSMSPANPECVYFLLHHVIDYHCLDKMDTAVECSNGLFINAGVRKTAFKGRMYYARKLRDMMALREPFRIPYDGERYYQTVNEADDNNYYVKKQSD